MTIYLDTNILPRKGPLRSASIDALLRIAREHGQEVAIPEIVLHESINARYDSVRAEIEKLRKALADASNFFEVPPIYLPDIDEVVTKWEQSVRSLFRIIPDKPEHALESLRREARRVRPASKGRGARDSLIWLTIIYHAEPNRNEHFFVSQNTNDFEGSETNLRSELLSEIHQLGVNLNYTSSLDALLTQLAPSIDFSVSHSDASSEEHKTQILYELLLNPVIDDLLDARGNETLNGLKLELDSVVTHHAYQVGDTLLVSAKTLWKISLEGLDTDDVPVLEVSSWLIFEEKELKSAEIRNARLQNSAD